MHLPILPPAPVMGYHRRYTQIMHDLNYFRANFEQIAARLATRSNPPNLDRFRELDVRRRSAITKAEQLQAKANEQSVEIGKLKKSGADTAALQEQQRAMKAEIAELNALRDTIDAEFQELLAGVPNVPHESAPVGKDADDNLEVRRVGEPPQFDFEPKAHWDLGPELGILDLERATKITGARFALYWDMGAKLERALINFMLDTHTREHGYTEVLPPFLVNSASLYGTGQLPKFKDDLFKCENHDLWLIPTAEVPVTNIYRDETLDADALPVKLCAYTPCFRSEAGSHGRDVRGIIRQHQFQKVELVKFTRPDQSYRRTGEAHRRCGGHPAPPGAAVPHGELVHRRYRVLERQNLRHRSLAAWAERVQGNLVLLELRGVSGAAGVDPHARREEVGIRAHTQRQWTGDRADVGRDRGELPAERRHRGGSSGVAPVSQRRSDSPPQIEEIPSGF